MTLPDERYRAVIQAKNLLAELCNPQKTPRVPKHIRERALSCLRHYPSYWDLERVSRAAPDIFSPEMEDVTRMFKKYELSKDKKNED